MRENIETIRAVDGSGRYIFISYSSKDRDIVHSDHKELLRHDVPMWIDLNLLAGTDWRTALKMLRSKNCVGAIFYISENSITSKPVQKELRTAIKRFGKPIAVDKNSKERLEGYFSINIGGKAPSEIQADMRAAGRRGRIAREFLKYFNKNIVYIARDTDAGNFDHFTKLLGVLEMYDVMKPGVCDDFKYQSTPDGIVITGYIGNAKSISIPDEIIGRKVVGIANDAFKKNTTAETLHIPDSVTSIGEGAFREMTSLREIRLPAVLDHLGEAAFRDTISLKTVDLPTGLKKIEQAMFKGSGIETLTLPDGIEELDEAVFAGCSRLETLIFPYSVRTMTEGGFRGCSSLKTLTIPQHITGLRPDSLSDCPAVDVLIGNLHYHDGIAEIES